MPRRILPTHLYHTTPLHYAAHILSTGALYSHSELVARRLPILPRASVAPRDRKHGLHQYVHLSLTAKTPLLTDKLARGYPHVLISFPFEAVLSLPGTALLPYNGKAWRHREDFLPLVDPEQKIALLEHWQQGRYPSAEVLVPGSLSLKSATGIYTATAEEADWLTRLSETSQLENTLLITEVVDLFGGVPTAYEWQPFNDYADACRKAGQILPPPDLPFD